MQAHTISMGQRQFRIGDLADELKVKKFVIRFWEQEFGLFANRSEGGHRFYTTADLRTFQIIKDLLHNQGYTIEGARKQLPLLLKETAPVEAPSAVEAPVEIVTAQVATEIPVLEVVASSMIEIVQAEETPTAEFSVQPAVEAPAAQDPLILSLSKNRTQVLNDAPLGVEERETENWGAHVDEQTPIRTCHHEEIIHIPISAVPCTTCEKHSRHLAMVKDELQELVKRLR